MCWKACRIQRNCQTGHNVHIHCIQANNFDVAFHFPYDGFSSKYQRDKEWADYPIARRACAVCGNEEQQLNWKFNVCALPFRSVWPRREPVKRCSTVTNCWCRFMDTFRMHCTTAHIYIVLPRIPNMQLMIEWENAICISYEPAAWWAPNTNNIQIAIDWCMMQLCCRAWWCNRQRWSVQVCIDLLAVHSMEHNAKNSQ